MRANDRKGRPHSAPRYKAVAGEAAGRARALDERRAEIARLEAARFFQDLRKGLRLARVAVANRVGTDATIIEALEQGTLDRLPPWPLTVKIVSDYTRLAGLDPRPVLHALHAAYSWHQRMLSQQSWATRMTRKLAAMTGAMSEARQHRARTITWAAGLTVPAMLVGSLLLTTGLQASQLKPFAAVFGLSGSDRAESVKRLEGLVWIDAADPRQRRGDKLPGTVR